MKIRLPYSSTSVTAMTSTEGALAATGQYEAQVEPGMNQNGHLQALATAFPQPTQEQCLCRREQHPDRTLVQGVQGREQQGDQYIGQAQRAPMRLNPGEQPVVQAQAKHALFGDRCDQQQREQGGWGAGCGAKADADLQRKPGANRSADASQAIGGKQATAKWLNQWCHGLRMIVALGFMLGSTHSFAGLGQDVDSIKVERKRMAARHQVQVKAAAQYSLHELQSADGSRVRQYVSANGMVFAVSWHTLYKPDLSTLLGTSYPRYAAAAQVAAQRGGVQRQFRHTDLDLVLQSSAHLHVFSGFAFRRSMLPRGLDPHQIGLE